MIVYLVLNVLGDQAFCSKVDGISYKIIILAMVQGCDEIITSLL